ncbi:MAG: hypothetical protein LBD86_07810 [Spirochaetaceae bacterium]|jgi:uncharacterized protein YodC (DUF2158 family)|nr:hypothetical protein [Spirochaetaceae bacterium]
MSVRATSSLIGDPVYVAALPDSPKMIVTSVDVDTRQISTVWFSDNGEAQQSVFPASALERMEAKKVPTKKADSNAKPARKKK